jgi:hypothetical protein
MASFDQSNSISVCGKVLLKLFLPLSCFSCFFLQAKLRGEMQWNYSSVDNNSLIRTFDVFNKNLKLPFIILFRITNYYQISY